jgi:hypothetical protein
MTRRAKIRWGDCSAGAKQGICALCGRTAPLTFHHLIPRKLHRRARFRKHFTRQAFMRGAALCRLCHDGIHDLYDEMTLARSLRTIAELKRDPRVRKHAAWVRRQKAL